MTKESASEIAAGHAQPSISSRGWDPAAASCTTATADGPDEPDAGKRMGNYPTCLWGL